MGASKRPAVGVPRHAHARRRRAARAAGALAFVACLVAGCSSARVYPGEVIQESVFFAPTTPPKTWQERPDQYRRVIERCEGMLDRAVLVESPEAVAAQLDLTPPVVVLVGEVHSAAEPARRLGRAILDRADAKGLELWEEGEYWGFGPNTPSKARGLLTRTWSDAPRRGRVVIGSGFEFNQRFAERAQAGGFPEQLLAYAGNAHVYYDPEWPNPYPPTDIAPAPYFVARGAEPGDEPPAPRRVAAYMVRTVSSLIDTFDIAAAQCVLGELRRGRLSPAAALNEAMWCRERLRVAYDRARLLENFESREAPGVFCLVFDAGEPRRAITACEAIGHLLTDPEVSSRLDAGWTASLLAVELPTLAKPTPESVYSFALSPPAGVEAETRRWTVGWRATNWKPGDEDGPGDDE